MFMELNTLSRSFFSFTHCDGVKDAAQLAPFSRVSEKVKGLSLAYNCCKSLKAIVVVVLILYPRFMMSRNIMRGWAATTDMWPFVREQLFTLVGISVTKEKLTVAESVPVI